MSLVSSEPTVITASDAAFDGDRARTYEVRTFGCQMNVHDSERLAGAMESAGYVKFSRAHEVEINPDLLRAATDEQPDVIIINTCAVRENASNKLYGTLGHLASIKRNLGHLKWKLRKVDLDVKDTLTCVLARSI